MEQVIKIDGREVRFKSSAAFAKKYRAYFNRNVFSDFFMLSNALSGSGEEKQVNYNELDIDVFYDIAWVLAKNADPSIPPVVEWLDEFDEFPLTEVMPKLMEMVTRSMDSSLQSNKATKKK